MGGGDLEKFLRDRKETLETREAVAECGDVHHTAAPAGSRMAKWLEHNPPVGSVDTATEDGKAECYVTLLQMAAIVNRGKRTLRRLYESGKLPDPAVEGGGGNPHEWRWADVRPILESEYGKVLPDVFPADKFLR
jgi:hypothetical protein